MASPNCVRTDLEDPRLLSERTEAPTALNRYADDLPRKTEQHGAASTGEEPRVATSHGGGPYPAGNPIFT